MGGIAIYNVVQNIWLTERGYVTGNVAVAASALAWARRSGVGWDELGLSAEDLPVGLAAGAVVGTVASGLALATRHTRLARSLLDDTRLQGVDQEEVWRRVLIRFPVGTALFEEVVFRGVLPAAFSSRPAWQRDVVSAGVFAAWHVIPTWHTVSANRGGSSLRPWQKAGAVAAGSVAAGFAGLGLAASRRWTSSLATPWLAHATVNGLMLAVAVRARRQAPDLHRVTT